MVVAMNQIVQKYFVKIENFNNYFSKGIESIGIAALFLIMIITFFDVIGAKFFLAPIFGVLDIVMLAQMVAISFAAASTLVAGRHIQVELFLPYLPKILRTAVILAVHILSLILFVLISWNLFRYGYSLYENCEVSPTAHISLYPFAYGAAIAVIPICIELFLRAMKVIFRFETKQI